MTEEEPGFDPIELETIAQAMDNIVTNEATGYEMMFWISHGAAVELLESYDNYKSGSVEDAVRCMYEFSKIVEELRMYVEEEDEEDDIL